MRADNAALRTPIINTGHRDPSRGLAALKGHDFSRAASRSTLISALAAEGMLVFQRQFPRGPKPRFLLACLAARLKPCPFKTGWLRVPRIRLALCAAVFLFSAVAPCCAQQPAPSAHELAQRVDHHYNQLHSLKAAFTESYAGLGMQRTESGTLLLLKPGRMRWDYSTPPGKLFLLDGKYALFYSPGDPRVQRIQAKQLDDLRSPLRFLLGHTELEKEMDNLTLAPAPGTGFRLSGQPKGQENRVSRLSITATADGTIVGIEVEETDDAITRFTFTGEVPNAAIPVGEFRFTPPPGVPVVDAAPPV
jgi:outer membrane lipoprotein carrier protein